MAFFQMTFRSEALGQDVSVNVLMPDDRKTTKLKTLWLLHGLSGNHSSWMRQTSIERYAKEYGLAVVMPCVDRSWYTDTAYGKKYFTHVTQELPEKIAYYFNDYSDKREDNLVIGLSMGGYGAVKAALTYPEKYGFCASLSGSLDITRKNRPYDLDEWRSIFGFDLKSAAELEGTKHDLFALADAARDLPYIYMWCGTEDPLMEANNNFSSHLTALGIAHTFNTSEGDHTWKYWDMHIQTALAYWKSNVDRGV
jgi:S-formylglutathione hydrolase FrmB